MNHKHRQSKEKNILIQEITRRDFIKSSALLGGSLAASAYLGRFAEEVMAAPAWIDKKEIGGAYAHHLPGPRRPVICLINIGADKNDELRITGVGLPVKLVAVRPFSFDKLVAHGFAGEIHRSLADRRMAVGIGGTEGIADQPLQQLVPAGF